MTKKVRFAFGVHNHQPSGNFDSCFEEAYTNAYRPLLDALVKYPGVKLNMHHSGILLDWISERHPDYVKIVRQLADAGRVELLTGGFYEPILPSIPEEDRAGQIEKLTEFIKELFGVTPKGAWLAERVWEPGLAKTLSAAQVSYTLVDDSHFSLVGIPPEKLCGRFVTEDEGRRVDIFPISKKLRYLIPFGDPAAAIEHLRELSREGGDALAVMFDDGEKFGHWPGSHATCYERRWLERFFEMLEKNSDWIETVTLGEAFESTRPAGMVYLPCASYHEMMKWSLPPGAECRVCGEAAGGGYWRNFLVRYPEANDLHKKMLLVSRKVRDMVGDRNRTAALEKLWAAQCSCAYWHGLFGGIYLPHIRGAAFADLIEAENAADSRKHRAKKCFIRHFSEDINFDGLEEFAVENPFYNFYFSPAQGFSAYEIDSRAAVTNIADTVARRPESYHAPRKAAGDGMADNAQTGANGGGAATAYDWYRKGCFIDHFFGPETSLFGVRDARYAEEGDFVNCPYGYRVDDRDESRLRVEASRDGHVWTNFEWLAVKVKKSFVFENSDGTVKVDYSITNASDRRADLWFGVEFNLGLHNDNTYQQNCYAPGTKISNNDPCVPEAVESIEGFGVKDDTKGLDIFFNFTRAVGLWKFPLKTVSNSENGPETITQGATFVFHKKFSLAPGESGRMAFSMGMNVRDAASNHK